jgi:hypothetical protein
MDASEHLRSLLMVHGEPGRPGYFVLLDEVTADVPGRTVHVNLHPDSARVTTVAAQREYQWAVREFGTSDVQVNLFLATPPASSQLLDGGLCAFDGNEFVGKYLRSTYPTDAQGLRHVVTLVVPHDAGHAKPALTRIQGGGVVSGATLAFGGGVIDYVLESRGTTPIPFGAGFFQAKAVHTRAVAGSASQYFVRAGRGFSDGAAQPRGFESDAALALFARGTEVWVTSAGTRVLFHEPTLVGNVFSTSAGTVTQAGPGFVEIVLAPGSHAFDLDSGAELQ